MSKPIITAEDVRYIASLARLHLTDAETEKFTGQLEMILHHIAKMEKLDLKDVKPTSHVLSLENVFRDDEVRPSLDNEQALSFAVEKHKGAFTVPQVIE